MVPPEAIMNDAVSRAGLVTATGLNYSGSVETVLATFTNVVFLISNLDVIRSWVQWKATLSPIPPDGQVFVRVRRNGLTGPIVFSQEMTVAGGVKSTGSSVIGAGSFVDFELEEPIVAGYVSYVLTAQAAANGGGTGTVKVDKFKMLQIAKSK
jgi:hypothetical protein